MKTSMKQKKLQKLQKRQEGKKKLPPAGLNLDQVKLFSKDMIKKKMKNMKNNITISNKKRNKLLKRLRHRNNEKAKEIEAIEEEMVDESKRKVKKLNPKPSDSTTTSTSGADKTMELDSD